MSKLSTESLLYDTGHAAELLNLDEQSLMAYIHQLSLSPKVDEKSGSLMLTQRDVDLLRKALRIPEPTAPTQPDYPTEASQVYKKFASRPVNAQAEATIPTPSQPNVATPRSSSLPSATSPNRTSLTGGGEKKENLALIVEAVSQAKEGILKDLARLLDDKLAGLDEVVVELIRCKSENDSLKQKLKAALDEKENLRYELTKFKPVQFGFYRKVN
jgi:hypothetical protein